MRLLRPTLGLIAVHFVLCSVAFAQEGRLESTAVEAEIQALEESAAEGSEQQISEYRAALEALARRDEAETRAAAFRREAEEAPRLLDALQAELETPLSEVQEADPELTLAELEQRLSHAEAELTTARQESEELQQASDLRRARQAVLAEEIVEAGRLASERAETLNTLAEGNPALRTQLLAELEAYQAEKLALEAERDAYQAGLDVRPLEEDRVRRQLAQAETIAETWRTRVADKRQREAEAAAIEAERQRQETTRSFPQLGALASRNEELAGMRSGESGLPARMEAAREELTRIQERLSQVRQHFRTARRKISVAGLTEGMGLMLRRDYEWLPDAKSLKSESTTRAKELSEAQLKLIEVEEERAAVGDLASTHARLMTSIDSSAHSEELSDLARELLSSQRDLHDSLRDDLNTLTTTLYEQERTHAELAARSTTYRQYIEERILWVRSTTPNPVASLMSVPGDLAEALSSIDRTQLRDEFRTGLRGHRLSCTLLFVFVGLTFLLRRWLIKRRNRMAELVRSHRTDSFRRTLRAVLHTLLLALPLPLLMWSFGWIFTTSSQELLNAVGTALRQMAVLLFSLLFARQIAAERGLGESHFRWPTRSMKAMRRELDWFVPVIVILGFVAAVFHFQGTTRWADSIGRTFFVLGMAAMAVFLFRLVRPASGVLTDSFRQGKSLIGRTNLLWSPLAVGVPLILIALSLAGYSYTAFQFHILLRYSIALAAGLVFINALLLRWLFVARRRLAVEQARAKARARMEAAEGGPDAEGAAHALDEEQIDIPAVDAQTRQLFRSAITLATVLGLYFIWSSALPALKGLDRVQLWPSIAITDSEPATTEGVLAASPEAASSLSPSLDVAQPQALVEAGEISSLGLPSVLTLADLTLALIFVVLTTIATRNLPGLLEISILQRLPLDSGSRYAVTTIVRYLILLIGVSLISSALGLGWEKIQWLAAALTFGLAFGLQEIFANFVSGLIILLERPIRVGDIVTVGETEGRVTRLRMRATTIQDYARREYLIPNKEFITGAVTNWTLTDPITRLIIPIGIAYGSDVETARRLLLQAAGQNSMVLDDPAPAAIFRTFGESSLDFELRVFIDNREMWPEVTDRLHRAIDQAFRREKIEISFPQRDLHIRSAQGLEKLPKPLGGAGSKV